MKVTLSATTVHLRHPFLLSLATAALVCASTQSATLLTNDTAIGVLDTSYEGAEIVVSNCTLTIDGAHAFSNLRLLAGSRLTHTYSSNGWLTIDAGSNYPSGLDLAVTNDVLVEAGSVIDLAGCGFGGGFGPGAGKTSGGPASGSGGGHGGFGGSSGTNAPLTLAGGVYDSAAAPAEKGSGGGRGFGALDEGATGGGSIRLVAGGRIQVDGLITADGLTATNRRAGGGAGGSIRLSSATLAGFGEIRANGGDGEPGAGGGGAGGRIALDSASNLFGGKLAAHGGSGSGQGGPGTIYSRVGMAGHGEVLADNAGVAGYSSLMPEPEPFGLTLRGGAILGVTGNHSVSSLVVASNACIVLSNQALTVLINAIIDAGGRITADALGYPANQGPGAGTYFSTFPAGGSGGGHGGFGGECAASVSSPRGGNFYGSLLAPGDRGSGGGSLLPSPASASGGGVVRLIVSGALVVNGTISADGGSGFGDGSGGASGGSIWISTGTLAGAGRISVDGGDGNGTGLYAGGGGAGGRISLQHQLNLFFGSLSARGGSGFNPGSAGTIYTKANNEPYGSVIVENGGTLGRITSWTGGSPVDLTVSGGGVVSLPSSQTLNNLMVGANGWVVVTNQQITVNGNVTVSAGGGIVADRTGYSSGTGSGMGRYDAAIRAGSGGGYGGSGGAVSGSSYDASGGICYGSPTTPTAMGSGGGGSTLYGLGGAGGGSLRLNVAGNIVLDGIISANGGPGAVPGGGGGSGGSVSVNTTTFTGSGIIAVNGGDGSPVGAGGGGGRISILATANQFDGTMLARGGTGSNRGGAGTIYTALKNQTDQLLLVDNGGQPGAATVGTSSTGSADLRISGGAVWVWSDYLPMTINRLTVGSNATMVVSNGMALVSASSVNLESGGVILADGAGYFGREGPGAGGYQILQQGYIAGGGGGYGGYGAGVTNTKPLGGNSYGSYTNPRDRGSGGGGYAGTQGGRGGGVIGFTVSGVLEVDGRISANGVSGTNSGAGGGAGGSIMISAGTLAGSGTISANGGTGLGISGGGGGGRIAVQCGANTFTGALSALGGATGDGSSFGGAGTIYVKLNSRPTGTLIVDNGGRLGTNTPLPAGTSPDLVISGGAVVQPANSQSLSSLSSLLVGSNAWLLLTTQVVTVTGNATVLAGGGIIADGTGYPSFQGPGRGGSYNSPGYGLTAGGAGYGGYGGCGAGSSLACGGVGYGFMTAPVDRGSGGGSSGQVSYGGSGGGAIRLNVLGVLAVAGRISANGTMGLAPGSGGGSGGSLWITAGTLSGSGVISANGGAGNGWGGGGGGGRIALEYSNNLFTGVASTFGGYGETGFGGAGTVCWRTLPRPVGQILVDNGGREGTNTSLPSSLSPFDLTIRSGASVWLNSSSLLLSNLVVGAGGTLTWRGGIDSCELVVLNDAMVESGGTIVADGKGFAAGVGPGAGATLDWIGSGAGYGGVGGASSSSPGGVTYGSPTMPADKGSGGGFGLSVPGVAGGEGGGAIRLSVGRSLVLNGSLTANGNPGLQDEAGGGSGGSLWIDAGVFSGVGLLSASGGNGEFNFGGGGGGGRVAIYSPMNFFGGLTSVEGGSGFQSGSPGTIYTSASHSPFVVSAQAPTGTFSSAVSQVDFTLTSALNPYTASEADFSLTSPSGPVSRENCFVTAAGSRTLRVAFPPQTREGDYTATLGPLPRDLYGNMLSQVHTGRFSIVWPQVHGTITDTNSQPLAGVVLQAGPGIPAAITDANGDYALKLPAGSTVTVIPSKEGWVFLPYSTTYANLSGDLWAQDYRGFSASLLLMNCQVQGTNLLASWFGVSGLAYQMFSSTNLVDWIPWDGQIMGSNAPVSLLLPMTFDPAGFFSLRLVGQR